MARHTSYIPHGVIPAVLLPFDAELQIDEFHFRKHLREVAATAGISAITVNAHSTEVSSCSFEEQRRVLELAQDEIGDRLALINGIWADGSLEAARLAPRRCWCSRPHRSRSGSRRRWRWHTSSASRTPPTCR